MTKFLISDDHPLFREALIGALRPLFKDAEIIESDNFDSTIQAIESNPDISLILLDLNMPGCENYYGLTTVTEGFSNIPVAVISANDSIAVVSNVMALGAKGFIPKATPTQVIAKALHQIMQGQTWLPEGMQQQIDEQDTGIDLLKLLSELTPKQQEVLKLVQNGMLNKQIAFDLNITEATVKAHISAILKKLGVNTRTQVVLLLQQYAEKHNSY
ncbi:response regulator transcription factor [Paraglaciecola aquimarina]|uniref:Response regulator transcription factor n=1 Tax=Paraglaciecola algarum TaxID=3050085 RepID=A0ABS9D7L9_9ALTE|nr:response regulator transcription factor [Paraglaciecola sp. G1-23]MCF2948920.1 response regulator transcription factor [Paraglaciecola sp. G1-23]